MKSRQKGVRWIGGREYLLCGRYASYREALPAAKELRKEWKQVIVRTTPYKFGNISCWVHGKA